MNLGISFDPTINLGHMVTAITLIGAILAAYWKIRERLVRLETMVAPMWRWWTKSPDDKTVDELEHEGRALLQVAALRRSKRGGWDE